MRRARPPSARKVLNAWAVVAKPPGTRTPDSLNWLIISPREAFLPPTASTSVILRVSKGATKAVARWVDDMGGLGAREKPVMSSDPRASGAARAAFDRATATRPRPKGDGQCGGGERPGRGACAGSKKSGPF